MGVKTHLLPDSFSASAIPAGTKVSNADGGAKVPEKQESHGWVVEKEGLEGRGFQGKEFPNLQFLLSFKEVPSRGRHVMWLPASSHSSMHHACIPPIHPSKYCPHQTLFHSSSFPFSPHLKTGA